MSITGANADTKGTLGGPGQGECCSYKVDGKKNIVLYFYRISFNYLFIYTKFTKHFMVIRYGDKRL